LGVPAATIAAGLSAAVSPAGRLEEVQNDLGATVIVDFAHTPAGLSEVLRAARAQAETVGGKVLVVFGCGGDRDRAKRPLMGSVASRMADVAVLTSDNPRSEDPLAIIAEVRAGCDGSALLVTEPDRRHAIAIALQSTGAGDVVIVAGKGHESVQQMGDRSIEFNDRAVILEELERLGAGGAGS
jgi:UDP-N-acetylmuramoyl-L-alanyl-D-glutamate--2,6-diaminopimelate ligase